MVSLMQARSEAIKNNRQAIVQPLDSTDWSKGWRIFVDIDKDKAYTEGTDTFITTVPAAADSVGQYEAIRNTAIGNLIGFDPNGFVLGRDAGRIVFSSSLIPSSEFKKGVIVSITGRARICTSQPGNDGCAGAN
jgi:type IV fimbrial biogenesis protein FimT